MEWINQLLEAIGIEANPWVAIGLAAIAFWINRNSIMPVVQRFVPSLPSLQPTSCDCIAKLQHKSIDEITDTKKRSEALDLLDALKELFPANP